MQNKNSETKNEFSFLDIWFLFKENLLLFFSITLIFLLSFSFYAFFIATPEYISKADVMVQVEQDNDITSNTNFDFVNAFRLIDTIVELMKKDIIINNAIDSLRVLGYSNLNSEYIRDRLYVNSSSSSYFINISFSNENPSLAKDVVDEIINAVIEETNVENAFPVLTDKIRRTSFGSEAEYYSPDKLLYSLLGLGIGTVISFSLIIFKDRLSNKFKSKEEIEYTLNIQILGVIPKINYKELINAKQK